MSVKSILLVLGQPEFCRLEKIISVPKHQFPQLHNGNYRTNIVKFSQGSTEITHEKHLLQCLAYSGFLRNVMFHF